MAAGLYLLLMWGYVALQMPQLFAVFAALIMSIALLFWVSEARQAEILRRTLNASKLSVAKDIKSKNQSEPSVSAANMRLDSLKSDLMEQYAQFGRDQSSLNSKGLGTWHPQGGRKGGEP